jgi:iron complex transport system permease protein
LNTLLVVRASLESAQTAAQWLAGSLNTMLWPKVIVVGVAVLLLAMVLVPVSRGLQQLAVGEDAARATGVDVRRVRTVAVVVGVALVSVATALTGPLAFVALAAPQVGRRLAGLTSPGLVSSALTGAVLVLGADLVAQHAFAREFSVGVVTGALGGVYLIGLLALERRRR